MGYLAGLLLGCLIFDLTAGMLLRPVFGAFWKLLGRIWGLFLWPAKAAVLGYESLSICSVMIFAVVCVMGGMVKDWVEFCKDLVDEE